MVWYNITAYNIKVKFVLRNNKEKVICNNKNDEGEMQMKRSKNLERAIVLGLILSTGVYGSAWAEDLIAENLLANDSGNPIGLNISGTKYESVKVSMIGFQNVGRRTTTLLNRNGVDFVAVGGSEISIVNSVDNNHFLSNNDAVHAMGGSNIVLSADKVFIKDVGGTTSSDAALVAKNTKWSTGGPDAANTLNVSGGDVQIIGNLDMASNTNNGINNKIILNLSSANSFWYGDEINYKGTVLEDLFGGGELDVILSNGAEWIYNSVDSISSLTLDEGGIVNLQDEDIKQKYEAWDISEYRSSSEHKSVTIENLKGTGGIFKIDLDWDVNKGVNYGNGSYYSQSGSDYIYIEKVEGTDSKQIVDFDASKAHLENMKINEDKLYFANVANGTTAFTTLNSVYSNAGNVFDYTYGTGNKGTDWYIYVSGKSAESNPNFSAAKGAMYAGYALGTELDTLNKRMGEARYLEEDDGVWVRYRHSKTGWDDTYETNGDMFQLGFDNEVTEKDGKHYRGVAIDYTDADTNIMGISGEGEHERYAVSLYDTWLGEKGHYRDFVLRGGRINSDYDVSGAFSNGYEDIGGDYHQWFGSISAEWGRKNDMGTGWYFEPQVQAQLARVGGASYVSDSGVDVDQDGATSLIGRAGFRIGREYVKDNGKHDNFYIKADLLHEFAGDKSFSLTGNDGRYDKEYDGQETWCDVGIGADISLGKNSYFWADVERTFGADFDNTWQVNGGFRWEF